MLTSGKIDLFFHLSGYRPVKRPEQSTTEHIIHQNTITTHQLHRAPRYIEKYTKTNLSENKNISISYNKQDQAIHSDIMNTYNSTVPKLNKISIFHWKMEVYAASIGIDIPDQITESTSPLTAEDEIPVYKLLITILIGILLTSIPEDIEKLMFTENFSPRPYLIIKAIDDHLQENSISDHRMLRIEEKSTVLSDYLTLEKFYSLHDVIKDRI